MKIGILGSGAVGQVLGAAFADLNQEVMMGTRDPNQDKVKGWVKKTGMNVKAGSFADAASFAELAVLCTFWAGTADVIKLAEPGNLLDKIVIDVTNPLDFSKGVPPTLALAGNDSGGEQVQRWLPNSKVVKCFNIVGNTHMYKPNFPDGLPDMFICGNDDNAKKKVLEILKDFGWPSIDLGGIEISRYLESLAMVWITYGFKTNTWNHAFKLLIK